ncbi:MAG: hypothetical protein ACJAY8_001433 [Sphingobacteriales bacterium]|jgi:hypothetical protein
MKQIVLNIEDSKYHAFFSFIQTLDYVSISEKEEGIPGWQVDQVNERMEEYKNNPDQSLDFDAAMSDIEKDL